MRGGWPVEDELNDPCRLDSLSNLSMNVLVAVICPSSIKEVHMARKSVKKQRKKGVSAQRGAEHVARNRVITFRISADEATLIQNAADRVPLARYSRDAVLAMAAADAKK